MEKEEVRKENVFIFVFRDSLLFCVGFYNVEINVSGKLWRQNQEYVAFIKKEAPWQGRMGISKYKDYGNHTSYNRILTTL